PEGVYRCVFQARTDESRVAILCVVAADRQGFRGIVAHQADRAGAVNRWRKVTRKRTSPADEVGGYRRHSDRPAGYRPLDPRRAPERNDRRTGEVSLAMNVAAEPDCKQTKK